MVVMMELLGGSNTTAKLDRQATSIPGHYNFSQATRAWLDRCFTLPWNMYKLQRPPARPRTHA